MAKATDPAAADSTEGDQNPGQTPPVISPSTTVIKGLDPQVEALLTKTNSLTQQLGELSTLAVAAGNYDLASKALTYARGLIDASNGIVKSLEEAG